MRDKGLPFATVLKEAQRLGYAEADPTFDVEGIDAAHKLTIMSAIAFGNSMNFDKVHIEGISNLDATDIKYAEQLGYRIKLLGITKTSSLLLLAQPAQLQAAFATGMPYMEPSWGAGHGGESGLQGSRPAEILKLWLGLRQLGLNGITALVEGAIRRRRQLEILLAAEPRLQLLGGPLHLLAFRPRGLKAEAADAWSSHTRQALLAQNLMLSRPCYHGHHHLKAVLGNPHTQASHLERLAQIVQANLPEAGDAAGLPRST
jgi:hypothetical protein